MIFIVFESILMIVAIIAVIKKSQDLAITVITVGYCFSILAFFTNPFNSGEPTAKDVYSGKTYMQVLYEYHDSIIIPVDTTINYKGL